MKPNAATRSGAGCRGLKGKVLPERKAGRYSNREVSHSDLKLEDALARHGKPEIFNTDQGSQFSGSAFQRLQHSNMGVHQRPATLAAYTGPKTGWFRVPGQEL